MDIWHKNKSPFGYETDDNNVDSYGVDHSRFSTRDELEYQSARLARENQLAENFSKQGMTEENYPIYGTNFWGSSPENNYGFGSSNIGDSVRDMMGRLNEINYTIAPNYAIRPIGAMENNNSVEISLQPRRTVYQSLSGFAQNNERWYESNPQKESFNYVKDNYETNKLVNDCLKSDRFRQFVSNIKQPEREGYGFHISDQPTNSGISQGLYDQFLRKYPQIAKEYPSKVKNLTQEQVDNIYCQEFYKPNHIETFNDNYTAEHVFDIGVNIGGPEGTKIVQNAYNDINARNIGIDGKFGTETVSAINQLQNDDLSRLNNQIVNRRYEYYDGIKDKDKYPGWYTRAKLFRH